VPPSDPPVASVNEFRPYRRFLSWFILLFVLLGSSYILASIGVTIYRRRHAVPLGSRVGEVATKQDLHSCFDELKDVVEGLDRYLESSHRLLGHYDVEEVQRWSSDGSFWRGQWNAVGKRCAFSAHKGKEWEELAVVHDLLKETEASYTQEIQRFGRELTPRLDRMRERLTRIESHLGDSVPPAGDH
jgi:hypothetical protein